MAKVKITGHASGSGVFTITAPNSNTDRTITLPDASVTLGTDATKLPLAGGTLTGNLDVTMTSVGDGVDLIDTHTAHGITDYLPTNASMRLTQQNETEGGGRIIGATDNTGQHALSFYGLCQDSAVATVNNFNFVAAEKSGTGIDTVAGSKKVLAVKNNTTELFHITGDGRGLSQFTAKAWVNFSMGGNSIRDSHNVGSITDNSQGNFSINFSNNMANANYSVAATGGNYSSGESNWDHIAHSFNYATNHFRVIGTNNDSDSTVDLPACSVIIFGD